MPMQIPITNQNKFLENDSQLLNLEHFQDDESSASLKLKRYIESQIGQHEFKQIQTANEFGQIQNSNEYNPSFKMLTIESNTNSPSKSLSGQKSDLDRFIDFYKRFQKSEISSDTPEVFLDKNLKKQMEDKNLVQSLSPLYNVRSQLRNNQDQQMFIDLDTQKQYEKQSNTLQEQAKYEIQKGSQSAQVQKQLPNLPLAQSFNITQSFGNTQTNPQFSQKSKDFMNLQENSLRLNLQPLTQNFDNTLKNSDFTNKSKESPVDSDTHMQEILNELRKDVLELKQQRGYPVSISPPQDQRNSNISQITQKQKKIDHKQEFRQADPKNEMRVRQKVQYSETGNSQKRSKSQGKKLIQNFMNEEITIKNLKQEPTIQVSPDQYKRRKVQQEYVDNHQEIDNQLDEDIQHQRPSSQSKHSLNIITNKNSALNRSIDSQSSNQHIFQFSPLSSKKQPGEEDSICEHEDQELINQTSLRSITRNTSNIISNFQSQQNKQSFMLENDNKIQENQQDPVINQIQIEDNKPQISDEKISQSDDDYTSEFELENQKVQVSFKETNSKKEEEVQPDFSDLRHLLNHSTLLPPKTQIQVKQNQNSPEVLQKSPKFQYQSFIPAREQLNSALTVQYQTDKMPINSNEYAYRCLCLLINKSGGRNWNQSKYLAQSITLFLGRPVNKKIVEDKPYITTSIVQSIQQKKILQKLKAIESLQTQKKQLITHDQNDQTDFHAPKSLDNFTQTSEPTRQNLSPFDTYDFLFIKDLVNNLNYDNEVLFDNANDLKLAFMFILQEHKKLQFAYQKEKRNQVLLAIYRQRIQVVEGERGVAIELAMKVRGKYEMISDVMKLAVEDGVVQSAANERLIEQLAQENKELRSLMNIHRDNQAAELIKEGVADLDELEQEIRQREIENNQDGKDQSEVDIEINAGLIAYEQDVLRMQEDYLTIIREEQDLQFNADIDEHKQILKGIYDDKLNQKTEEIIMELNKRLGQEIEQKLRKEFEQDYRQKIMNEMRQEFRQEVKEEVRAELTNEIRRQVTDNLTKELTNKFNNSSDLFKLQTQVLKNTDPYSSTFSQTTKQIEPNNSLGIPGPGNNKSAMFSEDSSSQQNKESVYERNSEGSVSGADFFDNQILSPEEQALLDQLQQREQGAQPEISEQDNPFLQFQKEEKDFASDGSDDEQNEANQEKNEDDEEEINEEFLQSFDQFDEDDDNNQFNNNQTDNNFQFISPEQTDKNDMIPPPNVQNFATNLSPINKNVNMIEFRDDDLDGDFMEFVQGMKQTTKSADTRNHSQHYDIKNNLQVLKNDQLDDEDSASHGTPPEKMLDKDDLFLGRENEVHFFLDEDEDLKDMITESNLDQTDGLSQIIKQIKKNNEEEDDLERDMDKEDEYDYFLDSHQDENMKENKGYHIIDEEDLSKNKEEEDSDHMEDEEMKQYYKTNMLEGFKEKLEQEDNINK